MEIKKVLGVALLMAAVAFTVQGLQPVQANAFGHSGHGGSGFDRGQGGPGFDRSHGSHGSDRGHGSHSSDRGHNFRGFDRGHDSRGFDRGHDSHSYDRGHSPNNYNRSYDLRGYDCGPDRYHDNRRGSDRYYDNYSTPNRYEGSYNGSGYTGREYISSGYSGSTGGYDSTFAKMVDNYNAAAYYSDLAAQTGAKILEKYQIPVTTEQAALTNSGTDGSDVVEQWSPQSTVTTMKTQMSSMEEFTEAAKRFDKNDPLLAQFCIYKEAQKKSLKAAKSATAKLLAKQLLLGNAGEGFSQCIAAAKQYKEQRARLEAASGTSCKYLNEAIKQVCGVEVDEDRVNEAIENVPKG